MRLKTLNGAPLPHHLDFQESSLLSPDECFFAAFTESVQPNYDAITLKWRRVGFEDVQLHTGWSQPYLPQSGRRLSDMDLSISMPHIEQVSTFPELYTLTPDKQSSATADDFLHQSFTFHDTLLSSQVVQDSGADETLSSSSFATTSFGTTASELSSPTSRTGPPLILKLPPKMTISPLDSLPIAQHLHSIRPQTPTINIICVLMAPPERREVLVRNGGYKMNLYDITVADDTQSAFKVTFWLRPTRDSNNERASIQDLLLKTLEQIKVGDILLLRNVALTSFRNTVYGQSLHPAITRARTTIDIMMKNTGGSLRQLGDLPATVIEAFTRVKRWARIHVAASNGGSRKRKVSRNTQERKPTSSFQDEYLPPDTLEAI
ncbi:hypothetical protein GQ44DRAFT_616744 [Phaeosphaeriaceae sp. PMI808]|nr:hypothetical protein GQ44DRAFT_616744 [Phaeosphaeriaceae sp. PMI808]